MRAIRSSIPLTWRVFRARTQSAGTFTPVDVPHFGREIYHAEMRAMVEIAINRLTEFDLTSKKRKHAAYSSAFSGRRSRLLPVTP
jgi:hypothetical protein